ncbi:MAG: glycerol-3-phosphate acyltransferase [Pseudomonadota bacterium]
MNETLTLATLLLAGYLLGSLSGSLLLGRFFGVDVRRTGSGNAGGTNALRARGIGFALPVVLIDVGKGAAGALLPLLWPALAPATSVAPVWLGAGCALAAVAGHIFPIFFGFRGGKGAGTYVGALAVLQPVALAALVVAWLACLVSTGIVGLSTILAVAAAMVCAVVLPGIGGKVFALSAGLLVIAAHHSNIHRLRQGTEPRFEAARLFGKRR